MDVFPSSSYQLDKICLYCDRIMTLDNFPFHYKAYVLLGDKCIYSYMDVCWDCVHDIVLDKLIFKVLAGDYKYNDVSVFLSSCTKMAVKHNIIKLDDICFNCNLVPAEAFHHPYPRRPLGVISLCNQCHVFEHNRLKQLYKLTGEYPEHYIRNYKGKDYIHTPSNATIQFGDRCYKHWAETVTNILAICCNEQGIIML